MLFQFHAVYGSIEAFEYIVFIQPAYIIVYVAFCNLCNLVILYSSDNLHNVNIMNVLQDNVYGGAGHTGYTYGG